MASVNDNLRGTIAHVKSATQKSPHKFAFFPGGEKALIINPDAKALAEGKREAGGSNPITGTCFYEDGKYVFETANDAPGSLAAGIKTCLAKFAGVSSGVIARKAGSGEREGSEGEAEESPAVKARKTKISAKVKALQDQLAALSKSAPQKVIPIRIKITQAGAAFKGTHLDEAEQRLHEAEEMLE